MAGQQYELGAAELEVLKALWATGPATVRDVLTCLQEQGRNLAYTTVLTFLTRLEQKGYVSSDKSKMAYVYRASLTRDRVTRSRLRNLVEELFDGAPGQLALQLVRNAKFTPEELAELQQLIEHLDTKQKRSTS